MQQVLQQDQHLEGARYKVDAERLERQLNPAEQARMNCLEAFHKLRDEKDALQAKLDAYDDAAHDLQNVMQLKEHLRDVTGRLMRSQETVAKYQAAQVCTVLN